MRINHLSLTNFRNYSRLTTPLPAGQLVLVGRNAQGKTGLLEAIYYLATASSPHATTDRQLINWFAVQQTDQRFMKLEAEVQTADEIRRLDIRIEMEATGVNGDLRLKKTVLINGLKRRVAELGTAINVVLFLPQDMALVEGSPSQRRRYLDSTLCQIDPAYCDALARYTRVLGQRNALLKALQDTPGANAAAQLKPWDDQLAPLGSHLIARRARALEELAGQATPYHRALSNNLEHLRLVYRPSFDPAGEAQPDPSQISLGLDVPVTRAHIAEPAIAGQLLAHLQSTRQTEIMRGMTLAGPHRDDFRFVANNIDLGTYGSRGQGRTAVLALKLAEVRWMQSHTGECPVLLLDEVTAELDPQRRRFLLDQLTGVEQSLLTTTDLTVFEASFIDRATLWQVNNGTISPFAS